MFCFIHVFEWTQIINLLILKLWILFYSTSSCRQHHAATSIFVRLWFCARDLFHQDPHYRFDWILLPLMHTVFLPLADQNRTHSQILSLSLSLYCNFFFSCLLFSSHAFIVSLHSTGIKNVWIIQLRASSVSKNCTSALKMMMIQNGSRQTLIPLPWVLGVDRQTLSQRSTCDVNWYQLWYHVLLLNFR